MPFIVLAAFLIVGGWCGGPAVGDPPANQSLATDSATTATEDVPRQGDHALVVCPADFREALQSWVQYRESQGVQVTVIDSSTSASLLTEKVRSATQQDTGHVLLIGDAPPIGRQADPNREIPMHYVATTVSAKFGSTPSLPTDHYYGDTDGDGKLDAAVGRLPVDSAKQLTRLIDRIKRYELGGDFSHWRNDVQLVGGVGGFGMVADATIEAVTRTIVTASLPTEVNVDVSYGSPGHAFYPSKRFTDSVVERFNRGCKFWVYAGHGTVDRLDRVPKGPTGFPVLEPNSLSQLKCNTNRSPIAVLLCCYTGAIDARVDSFAERMIDQPGGPIAVIAGSRVTMPYGNCSFTLGLVDSIYGRSGPTETQPRARRLGEVWYQAKRRLAVKKSSNASQLQTLVDSVALLVSPSGTMLDDERAEHALLYGLLGDPLLELHPPQQIHLKAETGYDQGEPVRLTLSSPIDGTCTISLHCPLGHVKVREPGKPRKDPNQTIVAEASRPVQAGQSVSVELTPEAGHTGVLLIRAHVAGDQTWATGGTQTIVRPPVSALP